MTKHDMLNAANDAALLTAISTFMMNGVQSIEMLRAGDDLSLKLRIISDTKLSEFESNEFTERVRSATAKVSAVLAQA
jgi:hypothetical protein